MQNREYSVFNFVKPCYYSQSQITKEEEYFAFKYYKNRFVYIQDVNVVTRSCAQISMYKLNTFFGRYWRKLNRVITGAYI